MSQVGLVIDSFDNAARYATLRWAQQYLKFPGNKADDHRLYLIYLEGKPPSEKTSKRTAPDEKDKHAPNVQGAVGVEQFDYLEKRDRNQKWKEARDEVSSFKDDYVFAVIYKGEWVEKLQSAVEYFSLDKLVVHVTPQDTGSCYDRWSRVVGLLDSLNSAKRPCHLVVAAGPSDPKGSSGTAHPKLARGGVSSTARQEPDPGKAPASSTARSNSGETKGRPTAGHKSDQNRGRS